MNVLVVDDEPQFRLLMKSFLAAPGWTIVTAENGEEAMEQLTETGMDLIVCDLYMPVMDGINDDGLRLDNFSEADIILMGVSRCGKTPTCLYLAMHYGQRAANYPLTDDDFGKDEIPYQLVPFRHKIFALTIDAARLHKVREARRPGSEYASLGRCQQELKHASRIYSRLGVPVFDTTSQSIEELAARLVKMI